MQEHPDGSLTPLPKGETDWAKIDAKSEEQLLEEALSDPDALPLTDEQLAQFERVELKHPVSIRLDVSPRPVRVSLTPTPTSVVLTAVTRGLTTDPIGDGQL